MTIKRHDLGNYTKEGTPDSIPNSEVKLFKADGTARVASGRVGSCQDHVFFVHGFFAYYSILMKNSVTYS